MRNNREDSASDRACWGRTVKEGKKKVDLKRRKREEKRQVAFLQLHLRRVYYRLPRAH